MSMQESLIDFLHSKQLLLVVDNCEHLLDAAAEVVEALGRACAGLVVLATSREGLALEGERVVPVPALAPPPAGANPMTVGDSDAVRLFVDRAVSVDPDFELSAGNAGSVAQVCRRLDGLPLAIELAAARITTMTPEQLARRLERRFDTLAGGRRRAVQRHQTLRAAIDWSYELCSKRERRLLARLAVFAGGCTREAAEAVCGTDPLSDGEVFDSLASLVGKHLVVAQRDQPEARYRLLETMTKPTSCADGTPSTTASSKPSWSTGWRDPTSLKPVAALPPSGTTCWRR
jgi:predicted ATPase